MTAIIVCGDCGNAHWADRAHDCHHLCDECDGEGRIWNNADPTSGQWVECECQSSDGAAFNLEKRG